jgi:hypothetical protein
MPVDRLPRIPKGAGRCPDCGKPSITLYCEGCAPSSVRHAETIKPSLDARPVVAFRRNGRPVYEGAENL